jgi:maltose/maltodextrin transport system substrate-binding protein
MIKNLLVAFFVVLSGVRAFSWVDGEVLVWIGGDKGWRGLAELGKKFEKEVGVPVKVEPMDGLTDKFQSAAQSGKGPDIVVWAHDRLGEWADAGLLAPLEISEEFKALPMTWDAVPQQADLGYPLALEAISLIYNKQLVTGSPPAQLSEIQAFAPATQDAASQRHQSCGPVAHLVGGGKRRRICIKKVEGGYDVADSGLNVPAVKGLQNYRSYQLRHLPKDHV